MEKCLHQLFAERCMESPNSIAVCSGSEEITYRELDTRASRLASLLRGRGVRRDVLVGLYVDRSIELIVGMLAILKAGGAYVPIDPAYPTARVQLLLANSAVAVVVSVARLVDRLGEASVQILCADDAGEEGFPPSTEPMDEPKAGDLAYVIYTSGTTGQPKGVMVEHRNVVRLFTQTQQWFSFGPRDVWTLFHSPSFDFSVWEIWGALLYGGRLVIVPHAIAKSPHRFRQLLCTERVTILNQTPSAFRQLIQCEIQATGTPDFALRLVIFAGEKLDLSMLAPWFALHGDTRPVLVNMYGITETTVHVTYKRLSAQMSIGNEGSLIGEPIPDLQLQLLDLSGSEVGTDTPGELYVAGAGVARGYLKQSALTAARFIVKADASGTPVRYYRSGDLALRRQDGELVYLGRADDQVKVNGFRIEPAEIEACLRSHPAVAQALVLVRDVGDGDLRLTAFVVVAHGDKHPTQLVPALTEKAERELPPHMRPAQILVIDEIPLTEHGKADKKALLLLAERRVQAKHATEGVSSQTEQVIADIAAEILQQPVRQVNDDLIALGMTSLALTRILLRINRHFGVSLTGSELGECVSVAALAEHVRACCESRSGR